jgi:hypothetical protein
MTDRPPGLTDGGDSGEETATDGVDQRRAVLGGVALVVAVVGFTAVRAAVDALGVPGEWVLVALPAFGVVGVVGFVLLVSTVVPE